MIACDLGSNTLRVVEIDCESGERIAEFEKIVKTAEGMERDGNIAPAAVERVVAAVEACKARFDFGSGYVAVTTAALRYAKNGREVADEIFARTGIRFEIIDGEREAEFTRIGVENRLHRLGIAPRSYLLLDLGGGSSEIVVRTEDAIRSESFPVGIVTLVEKYGLEEIERGIAESCRPVAAFAQKLEKRPEIFVGASGTPTTIAAFLQGIDYAHYDYRRINGYRLTLEQMDAALARLLSLERSERERWVGVGRDDLIIAGVKLLREMVRCFGFEEMTVIDDGLREGVGIYYCHEGA